MKKSRGNGGFLPKRKRWIFWCWTCPFWIRGGTRTCSEHSLPTLCCRCFPLLLRTNGKTYGNVRRKASQPQKRRASVSDVPLSRFQKNFRRLSGYGRMEKYHWQTLQKLAEWRNLHSDTELLQSKNPDKFQQKSVLFRTLKKEVSTGVRRGNFLLEL